MGLLQLLFTNPFVFVLLAAPLLYSVIIHEVAHGWVALRFGDTTAQRNGRLTLNPVEHIDPVGLAALLLVGFGWAKPVPVMYSQLRPFRLGLIAVALAGCLANICIAIVALTLLSIPGIAAMPVVALVLLVCAKINIVLAAFNLIPIPPLDGSRILMGILPVAGQRMLASLEPYGFFILIALLYSHALDPVITIVEGAIVSGIGSVVGF